MPNQSWISAISNVKAKRVSTSRSDESSICLPAELAASVPIGATQCIETFILTNYAITACPYTSNIGYLCQQPTSSGLTIGEGSLQCLVSTSTNTGSNSAVRVFQICKDVNNAMPNNATVIVATVQPTPVQTTGSLPSSIGSSVATAQVISIVIASDTPIIPATSSALSTASSAAMTTTGLTSSSLSIPINSATSTGSKGTPNAAVMSDTPSARGSPNMPKIVGIAVGVGAVVLLILGVLIFCFRRRLQRQNRRRSNRLSGYVHSSPPPTYEDPNSAGSAQMSMKRAPPSNHDRGQRYYGPAPVPDARRSFWRKSVKPEDIGVAISPRADAGSPESTASHQSMIKLLPKLPSLPSRALWPTPLSMHGSKDRQGYSQRVTSLSTVFDDEAEAQAANEANMSGKRRHSQLSFLSDRKRPRSPPTPLALSSTGRRVSVSPPRLENSSNIMAHLPLTPTYDNGNVEHHFPISYPTSRRHVRRDLTHTGPSSSLPNLSDHGAASYASPDRQQRNPMNRLSAAARNGPSPQLLDLDTPPRPPRKDSDPSLHTEIEDNSTPEEPDKRFEAAASSRSLTPLNVDRRLEVQHPQRSPVTNLKYPPVPHSASISRQALAASPESQFLATLAPAYISSTSRYRARHLTLAQAETGYIHPDTTWSGDYTPDRKTSRSASPQFSRTGIGRRQSDTINQLAYNSNMVRLTENLDSANRRPGYYGGLGRPVSMTRLSEASLENAGHEADEDLLHNPQRSPASKARLTPSKSHTGDLYLTVEI